MNEERVLELIHRDIDGEIDDQWRIELRETLSQNPESVRMRDELVDLCRVLDSTPAVQPPAGLVEDVMRCVRANRSDRFRVIDGGSRWAQKKRERLIAIRVGYGLAAAAVIGLVLAPTLFDSLGKRQMSGTMAPTVVQTREGATEIAISGATVGGTIHVESLGAQRVVHFAIESTGPWSVIARFDAAGLELNAVRRNGRMLTPLSDTPGEVRIDGMGRYTFEMVFDPRSEGQTVRVSILAPGSERFETDVDLR